MLSLYRHQRIEVLARELEKNLRQELEEARERDVFYRPTIAVGSRAMERFISERFALDFGVASNIQFMRPAELLHRLVEERLGGAIQGLRAWAPSALRFAILEELRVFQSDHGEAKESAATFLESYLNPNADAHDRRALLLATDLADILDRLIHYRPEETRSLRRDEIPKAFAGDPAAIFFQRLLARLEARLGETHLLALLEALARAPQPEAPEPPIHLFGISYLPPLHVQLLRGFAEERPLHTYLISPFEHFVERDYFTLAERDELSAIFHPLLAAWGSLSTDFLHRLYEGAEGVNDHLIEAPDEGNADERDLLTQIRSDLRGVREPSVYDGDDWNLEIHSTFGMLRQVEALRDRLLHLFAEDPSLAPRDVAILTPDPDRFGPLIEAVFSQEEEGLPTIPVTLTDTSLATLSEAGSLLVQLFNLATTRVTLPAVAGLFELHGLSARFGIGEDEQGELREILAMSMMRCHLDAEDPAADPEIPISEPHTVRAGLRRILLGSLMRDPDETRAEAEIVEGYLPLRGIHPESLELVYKLLEAMEAIVTFIPELRRPRSLDDWLELVTDLFENLLPPNDLGAEGILYQLGLLRLEYEASLPDESEPPLFDATAFAYELERRLDDSSDHPIGRRGGVVVSRLTPMRALPFRVIALLGLDEDRFPRRARHHALDLVAKKPRPGDRPAGREDRHLLFEALLAARDRLMIFYTGRDATTNEVIPPCVPVAELLDVLKVMRGDSARTLIEEHPLHPFSRRVFSPDAPAPIRSYSRDAYLGAVALGNESEEDVIAVEGIRPLDERKEPIVDVDLDDMIRFYTQPARFIARRSLRAALPEETLELGDREPLSLDPLENHKLRDAVIGELLEHAFDDDALDAACARIERVRLANGEGVAHRLDAKALAETANLARAYGEVLHKEGAQAIEWSTLFGVTLITTTESGAKLRYQIGSTERRTMRDELLLVTVSTGKERAMLEAWLLLAFSGDPWTRARIVYRSDKDARSTCIALPSRPSDEFLLRLVRVYLGLDKERFPVPLKPAFEVARSLLKDPNDPQKAMEAGHWAYHESGNPSRPSESERPENLILYRSSPFRESSPFYAPALALIKDLHVAVLAAEKE